MRDGVRVALLARPGAGADRLRAALQAAGADVVLDADPTTLEPAELSAAGAGSVVVLLDAAVEDALDRLDPVLHDPAIDVLYEEAEVAAAREGWDVARWTRHLSAKLLRHGDVLPPGRETDASPPSAPATVEPSAPAFAEPLVASDAPPAPMMFDPVAAEYDADDAPAEDVAVPDFGALSLEAVEAEPEPEPEAIPELHFAPEPEPEPEPEPDSVELTLDGDPPPSDATAAAAETGSETIRDFRRDLADIEKRIAAMSLVGEAPAAEPVTDATTASANEPARDPTTAPGTSAGEPPAIEAPAATPVQSPAAGAVLVLAGIGGPDAVRQFLGELPAQFPRPVLIQQRLDGGRHDRLVQQMARATTLPVSLAADGDAARAGHVYILPPDVGLAIGEDGLRFASGGSPISTLPAADSAVLMFSGSDTALVDAAMEHAQAGAMVAGQSPEDCYDAAASDALVARGAESGQPAELARRLAGHWAA